MKKYSKFFAILLAFAMILPGFAQTAQAAEAPVVTRLGGVDRVGTAVLASQEAYKEGADAVVLAGYGGDVDALTGTLLASAKKAPLLITRKAELSPATKTEIARLNAKTVYILGGEGAVSAAVATELAKDYTVKRIAGTNREDTAIAVAKEVKGSAKATHVFLALGRMPNPTDALADALAIGPVSAMKEMPVLLTNKDSIPAATVKAMKDMGVTHVTIVGGTGAVSAAVATELGKTYEVDRVYGSGREDTALAIAAKYFPNPTNLIVAYGRKSADALVGGYLGALKNAPILLSGNAGITETTKAYITANPLDTYILGGTAAVTQTAEDQVVEALGGDVVVGDLKVESVSAINKTTIRVTFNQEVDAVEASNFTVMVGGVAKTIDTVGLDSTMKIATLTVQGLEYTDVATVTVSGVKAGTETAADYTGTVTVPAIGDLFELKITSDDEDQKIVADGATKIMLTATLIEKATGLAKDVDGLVTFTTTKGAVAQPSVALQDGKASVQLTSAASDETIVAYINAVVSDAPGATEYEGLAGQYQVIFVPEGTDPDEVKMVVATYAESNQADRIFVTFSGKITRDSIVAAYPGATTAAKLVAARADNFGFRVDGTQAVKDIKQKADDVLELILNVDNQAPTTMLEPGVVATTEGYLRDNITHNVSIPTNVGTVIVANSTGITFKLTDAKKPSIFGVTVEDNLTLRVRFSEAMAEDIVEETVTPAGIPAGARINEHFRVDGRRVMLTAGANASAAEKLYASSNNYILANSLYVSADDVGRVGYISADKDTRHIVTINLDRSSRLGTGTYTLQAANVGDWAAMTDPANMVATQTFDFSVVEDTTKPTATIEVQSPEQWLVTFSQDIDNITGKTADDVFKIYKADDYAENPKVELNYGVDYQVTSIDEDGLAIGSAIAAGASVSGEMFLIEFLGDWTEDALAGYDTETTGINYFHSTKNPYRVAISNVENNSGNTINSTVLSVTLAVDGKSPTIAKATDVNDFTPKTKNGQTAVNSGELVYVQMSEPIKMNLPGVQPTEGLTPSQQQTASAGVPVPTFEFVKGDKTINGTVAVGSLAEDDQSFVVRPVDPLEAGTWTLYIRSISDDVGNTSPTATKDVVVKGATAVVSDTRVAWAGFDNDDSTPGSNDYIYIKFTKPMKSTGANGVASTTNYVFQGVELPEGSRVDKGIKNVTNDWDGVTIVMPAGTWDGLNGLEVDFTNVLNVANNFVSADGEVLSSPYEIQLDDTTETSADDKDMLLEAYYANTANALGGSAVTGAIAKDSLLSDGKIDTIELIFSPNAGSLVGTEIKVNGKTFEYLSGNLFRNKTTSDLIDSTESNNLQITKNGAIIINTTKVVDDAAPLVKKAQLSSDKKKLTVTMSEKVSGRQDGIFQALTTGDFTFSGATYTLATDGHVVESADKLVFDVVGSPLSTDTIAANATVFDMNINTLVGTLANPANTTSINVTGGISVTGVTGTLGAITQGSAVTPATFATGTVTYGTPVVGDTVVIGGQSFKHVASSPAANEYSTIAELTALIDGEANISATDDGSIITITADTAGVAGNAITLAKTGTGTTTVSGATLTGGAAATGTDVTESAVLTIAGPATANGTLNVVLTNPAKTVNVPVVSGQTAIQIATNIKTALGTVTGYTVTDNLDGTITFTSTTPNTNITPDLTVTISNL